MKLERAEAQRIGVALGLGLLLLFPSICRLYGNNTSSPAPLIDLKRIDRTKLRPIHVLWLGEKLKLNEVTAEQLSIVPGIGDKLSQKIIQYRDRHGLFRHLNELEQVRGVGPQLKKRISLYVRVASEKVRER